MNSRTRRIVKVRPTGEYPCQWDDLIIPEKKTLATIYTLSEGKKDGLKAGIRKADDGVYDVVVKASKINYRVVRNTLKELEKITHCSYVFDSKNRSRFIS